MRRNYLILATTSVASLIGGGLAGYFYADKKLRAEYDERLQEEIAETKKFYRVVRKEGEDATPADSVASRISPDVAEAMRSYASQAEDETNVEEEYEEPKDDEGEPVEVVENVFSGPEGDAFGMELEARDTKFPYIISKDEFMSNEPEHDQITMTYFKGDDVLSDDGDEHIPHPENVIGEETLTKFGVGSGDPHVVYVRNEYLSQDYEILRSGGKYTVEVLGFIEHSDDRRTKIRKFRGDDE